VVALHASVEGTSSFSSPLTTANFRVIRSGLIQAPLKKLEHYKHFNSTKTKRVILLLLPRD
jgi:hypothetical protein